MVPEPPYLPSDSPAAKTGRVRQLPVPVFPRCKQATPMFYKPERNQSARILHLNLSFMLFLVYTLPTPEGGELGPLCETVTLQRE